MVFKEQMFANFLGSLLGFIFAIVLFLITGFIRNKIVNKNIKRHLKREFKYDISLLQEWIDEIDKILRKITASDIAVYSYLKYSLFQRYFMQEAFKLGIMYELFSDEDISNLNYMLVHCDTGGEQYVNSFLPKWRKQEIDKKEALINFEFQKERLGEYKKYLEKLLKVLK